MDPADDAGSDRRVAALFDELCLRWVREADVVVQQTGSLPATLVLLPRATDADEVAIRLEGLRGNLLERADALVAELRPQTDLHDPAGLVLMLEARLGVEDDAGSDPAAEGSRTSGLGTDGAVVYTSLGRDGLRRATALRLRRSADGTTSLVRADVDPPEEHFRWIDQLLRPRADVVE